MVTAARAGHDRGDARQAVSRGSAQLGLEVLRTLQGAAQDARRHPHGDPLAQGCRPVGGLPLFTGGIAYSQNAGLDTNKDGKVTKREAAAKVMGLLEEGLRPGNVG